MAEAAKKPNANEIYQGLTGTQKCAILMMLIGEDEAAEIMGNLSPKEVQVLGSAMYSVQGLGQDTVNLVSPAGRAARPPRARAAPRAGGR